MGGMASTSPTMIVPKGPVAWPAGRQLGELKTIPQLIDLAETAVADAVREAVAGATQLDVGLGEGTLDRWVERAAPVLDKAEQAQRETAEHFGAAVAPGR